jgi:hypothetical protein
MPVSPVAPMGIRVDPEGRLAIRDASGDPELPWAVIDMANPLLIAKASDEAAEQWRTWRETWPTLHMVSTTDLAEIHEVDRALPNHWRRDPEFPLVAVTINHWPGWWPEQVPHVEQWRRNRLGRTGRPPKDQP